MPLGILPTRLRGYLWEEEKGHPLLEIPQLPEGQWQPHHLMENKNLPQEF